MANVEFYIPKNISVPLDLTVCVDGEYINYARTDGGFIFSTRIKDKEKAMDAVKQIINVIVAEHDEVAHGVWWETKSLEFVEQEERYKIGENILWRYRIKDIY